MTRTGKGAGSAAARGGVMISDVLFDAITEIERYETNMPDVYGDAEMKARIADVKAMMRSLQAELDDPCEHRPPSEGAQERCEQCDAIEEAYDEGFEAGLKDAALRIL